MTERKTITLYLAVSESGDPYVDYSGTTSAADAIDGLFGESGYDAVRVVKIDVTLDLPTVETVNVDAIVPPETKSPAQVTVSSVTP